MDDSCLRGQADCGSAFLDASALRDHTADPLDGGDRLANEHFELVNDPDERILRIAKNRLTYHTVVLQLSYT